jgi:hypothetical protein
MNDTDEQEKLDFVLDYIGGNDAAMRYDRLMDYAADSGLFHATYAFKDDPEGYLDEKLQTMLAHLMNQRYVVRANEGNIEKYRITTEGKLFIASGGYINLSQQEQKKRIKEFEKDELEKNKYSFEKRKTYVHLALTAISVIISLIALYFSLNKSE